MTSIGFASNAYASAGRLVQTAGMAGATGGASPAGGAAGGGFAGLLAGALDGAASTGHAAEKQALSAATGKANLVDVVTAVAESETALQTLVAVRDRMISAYEEIMRMPV